MSIGKSQTTSVRQGSDDAEIAFPVDSGGQEKAVIHGFLFRVTREQSRQ